MNEKELEALIAEVEKNGMIAPPVYLKDRIMEKAHKSESAIRRRRAAKIEFFVYSAKIVGAAAAAILVLAIVPSDRQGATAEISKYNSRLEKKIEKDVEQYRQENERIWSEPVYEENSFNSLFGRKLDNEVGSTALGKAASIWNGISVWLGMEENNYD